MTNGKLMYEYPGELLTLAWAALAGSGGTPLPQVGLPLAPQRFPQISHWLFPQFHNRIRLSAFPLSVVIGFLHDCRRIVLYYSTSWKTKFLNLLAFAALSGR